MKGKKPQTYITLQRIAALPYNSYFKQAVEQIREKYGVSEDTILAKEWFKNLLREHNKNTVSLLYSIEHPYLPHTEPVKELEIDKELRNSLTSRSTSTKTLQDTGIPIEKDILTLLHRFSIPCSVYFVILLYTLTYSERWLDPLYLRPMATCSSLGGTGDISTLTVTITGIYPWTTKAEWDDLWDGWVKDYIEDLASFLEKRKISRRKSREDTLFQRFKRWYKSYQLDIDKQMKKWSEWYDMVRIQGLTLEETANRWRDMHEEEYDPDKDVDLTTISKAVAEFEYLITPTATDC
jgi:hypothetical protein